MSHGGSKRPIMAKILLGVSGIAVATAFSWSAVAENEKQSGKIYDSIVVTAQKRAQDIQDVGITMNAYSRDTIDKLGWNELGDLDQMTPGLIVSEQTGSSTPNYVMRGVGFSDFLPIFASPVAVHVDEVPLSTNALMSIGMFDVDRVEVLKGPQGTLFGQNATGGAINLYTKKPTTENEAGVDVGYSSWQRFDLESYVSGSLGENVQGRLSGRMTNQNSGPYKNTTIGRRTGKIDEDWGLRGQLAFQFTDTFEANLQVFGSVLDREDPSYHIRPLLDDSLDPTMKCAPALNGTANGGNPECYTFTGATGIDSDPFTTAVTVPDYTRHETYGLILSADWDLGFATLHSITGYMNLDRDNFIDLDGLAPVLNETYLIADVEQWTQELRLSSNPNGSALTWQAGVLFSTDDLYLLNTGMFFFAGDPTPFPLGFTSDQTTDSYAIFGQIEYAISETLTLIAGARYTEESLNYFFEDYTFALPQPPAPVVPGINYGAPPYLEVDEYIIEDFNDDTTYDNISWKIGLNYQPNDDILVYASATRGFVSGGYSGLAFGLEELVPTGEEQLTSYEVGLKSEWNDGRVVFNIGGYFYDYEGLRLQLIETVVLPNNNTSALFRFNNTTDAEVLGVEAELTTWVTDSFMFSLNASWMDTEITAVDPGNIELLGQDLNYAPNWMSGFIARYVHPVSNNLEVAFQLDGSYKGDHDANHPDSPYSGIDSYFILNGRVSLAELNDSWEVAVWGKNLADEEYRTFLFDFNGSDGATYDLYGYPRSYGIELKYRF